jgi:hypothetical protein
MLGARRNQPQSERSLSVAADSLLPEEGIVWKEKKDEMRQSKREKTHGMGLRITPIALRLRHSDCRGRHGMAEVRIGDVNPG